MGARILDARIVHWKRAGLYSVEIDLPHTKFTIDSENYTKKSSAKRAAGSLGKRMLWLLRWREDKEVD